MLRTPNFYFAISLLSMLLSCPLADHIPLPCTLFGCDVDCARYSSIDAPAFGVVRGKQANHPPSAPPLNAGQIQKVLDLPSLGQHRHQRASNFGRLERTHARSSPPSPSLPLSVPFSSLPLFLPWTPLIKPPSASMASRSNPTYLSSLDMVGIGPRTQDAGREVELDAAASAAYSPLESLGRRVGLARSNSLQVRATLSDRVCLAWLSDRADLTGMAFDRQRASNEVPVIRRPHLVLHPPLDDQQIPSPTPPHSSSTPFETLARRHSPRPCIQLGTGTSMLIGQVRTALAARPSPWTRKS